MNALWHYRRAVALAAQRDFAEAQVHATLFTGLVQSVGMFTDPAGMADAIEVSGEAVAPVGDDTA